MKKRYTAPDIAFESFSLSVSIADCSIKDVTYAENICGYEFTPEHVVFISGISGCAGNEIIEGESSYNGICYDNPTLSERLYTS